MRLPAAMATTLFVANVRSLTVSVIDAATNAVTETISVNFNPTALGVFIIPPDFAGAPGFPNFHGQTIAELARFGGLDAATAALGLPA